MMAAIKFYYPYMVILWWYNLYGQAKQSYGFPACMVNFLPSENTQTDRQTEKQPQRDIMTGNTYTHTVMLIKT